MSDEEFPSRAGVVAAVLFTVALIAFAVWIAGALIAGVKQQNCVMSGRRDCLDVPGR